MSGFPPNPFYPRMPQAPVQTAAVSSAGLSAVFLENYEQETGYVRNILLSIALHVGILASIWLLLFILQFFGINLLTFDRPERVKDIEFQLVTTPDEKPRDPRTKNRAVHNSRAGGEKIPNRREAETVQKAGTPTPKPTPKPQPKIQQATTKPQQAKQRPAPKRNQNKPTPKPVAQQQPSDNKPAPPRPRVTAPKPSTSQRRVTAPRPTAPIKVPDAAGPVADTGPVVKGPSGGGSTSGSSGTSAGPVTAPGQFSGGSRSSAGGGPRGQGGRGSYSQAGSPGGGGGRPGVDALAEPDWGLYISQLQQRIRRNWFPPQEDEDKIVVMVFTLAKDGRLLNLRVARSSGSPAADAAARRAVEMSAPFRPFPPEARVNSMNIEFSFDYNVVNAGGGIRRR